MPEIKLPVSVFQVEFICDVCGEGKMLPTGIMLPSKPEKYEHVCSYCNQKENFEKVYGQIVIEPEMNPREPIESSEILPCPFCGHDLETQDMMDTIYPVGRSDDLFQIVCQGNAGGCDASMLGSSPEECVRKWNKRV